MLDLRAQLELWDGETPDAWKPEPGDILVGTLLSVEDWSGEYGPTQVAIICEEETNVLVSLWLSPTVLRSEWERKAPRIGERLGVKYAGKHPGRDYHRYALLLDRSEPPAALPAAPSAPALPYAEATGAREAGAGVVDPFR